jgi:hypothetical protein
VIVAIKRDVRGMWPPNAELIEALKGLPGECLNFFEQPARNRDLQSHDQSLTNAGENMMPIIFNT